MTNTLQRAQFWLDLVAQQPIPQKDLFLQHIANCTIGNLCTCGCNSFGLVIPEQVKLPMLQNGSGLYCELAFTTNSTDEIDILIFTDARGYLSSIDVTCGFANHAAVPDNVSVVDLVGVWGARSNGA